jgi:hypothetical protein
MDSYRTELLTIVRSGHRGLPPGLPSSAPRRRSSRVDALDSPLRCVSSGYLSGGCSCRVSIPRSVVIAAWGAERERGGAYGDRFFHFAWRGDVWLAYGLKDGRVRGVYCPTHRAERDEHSSLSEPRRSAPDGAPPHELALIA